MAKKKRIHGDVRLEVTSELPIYQNRTLGRLRYLGDLGGKEQMEFVEEEEPAKKVVETKWVKLRYDKAFKMRVTKHKETGDIRIAFRVTPQDAELLNNRLKSTAMQHCRFSLVQRASNVNVSESLGSDLGCQVKCTSCPIFVGSWAVLSYIQMLDI